MNSASTTTGYVEITYSAAQFIVTDLSAWAPAGMGEGEEKSDPRENPGYAYEFATLGKNLAGAHVYQLV